MERERKGGGKERFYLEIDKRVSYCRFVSIVTLGHSDVQVPLILKQKLESAPFIYASAAWGCLKPLPAFSTRKLLIPLASACMLIEFALMHHDHGDWFAIESRSSYERGSAG
eukprot:758616-Hanusia_phi.AAC.1